MLAPPTETIIGANNEPALTISNGFAQAPKELNMPTMEEFIAITTAYNAGENRTPRRVNRTGIDGSIPVTSGTSSVYVSGTSAVCNITPPYDPHYVLWNKRIGNMRQTNTSNIRETN